MCGTQNEMILTAGIQMKWVCDHRSESQFKQLRKSPKKRISGLQRDSSPWPLCYRCSALPAWAMKTHTLEAGQFIGIALNFRCAAPPTFVDKFQKFLWLACCVRLPPLLLMVARLNRAGKMSSVKYIFFRSNNIKLQQNFWHYHFKEIENTSFNWTFREFLF